MYARVNIIFGTEDKVSAGVAHLEDSDRAAVEATAGNRGLSTMVDPARGMIVAVSYWDELHHSSEAVLTQARDRAAAAAGGEVIAETFEVALTERQSAPSPGAAVGMTRVRLEPQRIPTGLAYVQDTILSRLRAGPGLCTAELLIDRQSGGGLFVTTWADEDGVKSADSLLDSLRDDALLRGGAVFPRTETYQLVRTSI